MDDFLLNRPNFSKFSAPAAPKIGHFRAKLAPQNGIAPPPNSIPAPYIQICKLIESYTDTGSPIIDFGAFLIFCKQLGNFNLKIMYQTKWRRRTYRIFEKMAQT